MAKCARALWNCSVIGIEIHINLGLKGKVVRQPRILTHLSYGRLIGSHGHHWRCSRKGA